MKLVEVVDCYPVVDPLIEWDPTYILPMSYTGYVAAMTHFSATMRQFSCRLYQFRVTVSVLRRIFHCTFSPIRFHPDIALIHQCLSYLRKVPCAYHRILTVFPSGGNVPQNKPAVCQFSPSSHCFQSLFSFCHFTLSALWGNHLVFLPVCTAPSTMELN